MHGENGGAGKDHELRGNQDQKQNLEVWAPCPPFKL